MKNILFFMILLNMISCSSEKVYNGECNAVLKPGMRIDADLPFGKICIEYVGKNKRRVTSELFDKVVPINFPGNENWKINKNIISMQYSEGIDRYTYEDVLFISKYGCSKKNYELWRGIFNFDKQYYTSNGILVIYKYEQMPSKKMIFRAYVGVAQFLIDGKIPSNLPGHSDDLIKITYNNPYP